MTQHHDPKVAGRAHVTTVVPLKRLWAWGLVQGQEPSRVKARAQTQAEPPADPPQAPWRLQVLAAVLRWASAQQPAVPVLLPLGTQESQCLLAGPEARSVTYDVVPAVGAGVVLQQPGVHALPMKAVSAGDDPQFLRRERGHAA